MTLGFRRAAVHAALIAMLVRAMLPAGWMPDAQGGLTICSATLGLVHHDTAPGQDKGDHQQSHEECPFAAAPHLAAAPELPRFILPAVHSALAARGVWRAAVIAARFTPQSPRAPPLTA